MRSALTAQTTPEQVKDLLVAAVFTTCPPRPGSKLPTMFINEILLTEYDEAWSKLLPLPVKSAERLDGIEYRGRVIVSGSASRYFSGGKWSSRANTNITSTNTARDIEHLAAGDEHTELSIEKKNDRWSFHLDAIGGGDINPDEFAKKKLSCSVAMSDNLKSSDIPKMTRQ
jgi:hypothetical protein